jgi:hypothetical protein
LLLDFARCRRKAKWNARYEAKYLDKKKQESWQIIATTQETCTVARFNGEKNYIENSELRCGHEER